MTGRPGTDNVHALSTGRRGRQKQLVHDGSNAHTGDTCTSFRYAWPCPSAAPIQRFNNKSLNWPAWFRHFRAVADVHGWSKDQRVLQLVSYLDETAMNVAQELGDNDLYNYDVLVKLLSDRFDPASRVSAFRSRFHGRSRRHHEDADTFADALA